MTQTNPDVHIKDGGKVPEESCYIPKTNQQIKEIALGIVEGRIFVSWMIREHDMHLMQSIFMPLLFLNDVTRKEMIRDKILHFYENKCEAGPTSINWYPIFFSMRLLTGEDAERIGVEIKKILDFRKSYLGDENG